MAEEGWALLSRLNRSCLCSHLSSQVLEARIFKALPKTITKGQGVLMPLFLPFLYPCPRLLLYSG